jgi:hypothetical protein
MKMAVTGVWRKLHNEELHDFYSSPDISGRSNQGGSDGQDM